MDEKLIQQLQLSQSAMIQTLADLSKSLQSLPVQIQQSLNSNSHLNFQRQYSYRTLTCTTEYPKSITRADDPAPIREKGTLWLYSPNPFILIDTQILRMVQQPIGDYSTLDVDSDTVPGRTLHNHQMFLPDHPFIYLASYADCTHAISPAGVYVVPDLRIDIKKDDYSLEKQISFVLICNHYTP